MEMSYRHTEMSYIEMVVVGQWFRTRSAFLNVNINTTGLSYNWAGKQDSSCKKMCNIHM